MASDTPVAGESRRQESPTKQEFTKTQDQGTAVMELMTAIDSHLHSQV